MTILPIVAICAILLIVAYHVYGRLIVRWLGIDDSRTTPAIELADGNDFVPAPAPVVLGGHFTAIAAAGPVVGPILAGLMFGWLPALLWIMLGSIFIGGVHDAGALFASIRHRAASITQVVKQHMSPTAYLTFLIFVWISLIYVVIAFADVTAGTFSRYEVVKYAGNANQTITFPINGGAVVIGATAYLVLSVLMGLALKFTRIPWTALLAVCISALILTIWKAPEMTWWLNSHGLTFLNTSPPAGMMIDSPEFAAIVADRTRMWDQALLAYCFIASVVPMWLLLQPRGVIGATFLYAALLFGVAGSLAGAWNGADALRIQWPAYKGFWSSGGELLFPFLFITIACGACSGFHSIVASGTTSKQIRAERHIRPIGYGAMLLEAMVAIFALACVMLLPASSKGGSPDLIYANGLGTFMDQCGISKGFAVSFGLLAFSSFVFDTMDVCTRLGRYVLQELTGMRGMAGGAAATLITLAGPSIYLYLAPAGSFKTFWTIFGTSNQLLAALTLVAVSVWLWRTGRPVWFALLPAIFMILTTGTALVMNFQTFYRAYIPRHATPALINMGIAAVLFLLGTLVVGEALRVWWMSRRPAAVAA